MAEGFSGEDAPAARTRRFALLLEYDGMRFAGSQMQKNALSVQEALEAAIEGATGRRSRVAFAGRTDAGTHALGQVASFDSQTRLDPDTLLKAVNAWLPEDVVARDVAEVEATFDPRRDAVQRHYRYVVRTGSKRSALDRGRVWFVSYELDTSSMQAAASSIIGMHDFAAFAGPMESPEASTVRELSCFSVRPKGDDIVFDLTANAFLPHMVRRMVGSLVEVGRGRLTPDQYAAQLQRPPTSAGPVAPARGLYLMSVSYSQPLFRALLDSNHTLC
jgi:tRNA pseudouridine38-40 synthase